MIGDNSNGAVAGSFTLSAQMPDGLSLTFSGYVLQGEGIEDINEKMDVAAAVVARQRQVAEIPALEKQLAMTEDAKSQVETIIADLSSKEKLKSQEAQTLSTMRINLKKIDNDIRKGQVAIADALRAVKNPRESASA